MLDGDEAAASAPAVPPCSCCGEPSRYRCPACDVRTCSLACVNKHKVERSCTGTRNTAEYRAMNKFDDMALVRDYRFLEGVVRAVDSGKRTRRETERPAAARTSHSGLTPARQHLLREATHRGVKLELMPHGMQRQRENTSRFDARRRSISWRVELLFPAAGVRHAQRSVPEACTINELLEQLIDAPVAAATTATGAAPAPAEHPPATTAAPGGVSKAAAPRGGGGGGSSGSGAHEDGQRALLRHKLRAYGKARAADAGALAVFLPCEGPLRRADAPRFWRLPLASPLGAALAGKVVVEFPTLHVALGAEEAARFALVVEDTDEQPSTRDAGAVAEEGEQG